MLVLEHESTDTNQTGVEPAPDSQGGAAAVSKALQDLHPEEEDISAAAKRLRANAEFLAWLPRVRGLQIDQIQAHSGRLENARSLLDTLQEYAVQFND